jgi:hypothetical protein
MGANKSEKEAWEMLNPLKPAWKTYKAIAVIYLTTKIAIGIAMVLTSA